MQHPNIDLVQRLYAAYAAGDRPAMESALSPDIVWETADIGPLSGPFHGVERVLQHLFDDPHVDEQQLELVDMLASDERVAVVARARNRRSDAWLVMDYVQLITIDAGCVLAVREYVYDQAALHDFLAVPLTAPI